jgi:hypothetical protein
MWGSNARARGEEEVGRCRLPRHWVLAARKGKRMLSSGQRFWIFAWCQMGGLRRGRDCEPWENQQRRDEHTDGSNFFRTPGYLQTTPIPTPTECRTWGDEIVKARRRSTSHSQSISPWPSPGRTTGKAIRRAPTSDMQPTAMQPIKAALAILWVDLQAPGESKAG